MPHVFRWTVLVVASMLTACNGEPTGKTIEEMSPGEVERAVKALEAACRTRNISMGSRDWDDCIKEEAIRRGYTR
ncbi:MAG TPA: hypothetical protein PKW21_03775 [Rhabdaerophilum sp.]|nr:hypothetical protein [Rhabdaerophilum sp.]